MAGNKINTKTRGKEDKGKGNKSVNQNNEEGEEMDFTVLRKPIPTSITGFAQARKIFDLATEELKALLSNECDLLYECKVCRNLFRSLANFISHKRIYCKEKFNTSVHSHFGNINSTATEIKKIQRTEEGYQESLKQKKAVETNHMDDNDERIPLTKDLTTVYEKIIKTKGVCSSNEDPEVVLQKIPNSSVAVFQNMKTEECADKMRTEVNELDNILSRDKAVFQSDGKFTIESSKDLEGSQDHDGVIQISDDDDADESDILRCKICDLQFSTQKTLKFHMKYKHLESRLVYPCPDCFEIFSTSWSVYRHLFKVHRKTAAQIRRLRESIQAKAFKMNNRPAFYEKRKGLKIATAQKITEEERLDQENQAWMDNMEGDGEVPRCGGCGRTFERRAALAAHTHTCQPRNRALARRPDAKKIEIQIRKDYNKSTVTGLPIIKSVDTADNKAPVEDIPPLKPPAEEEKPPEIEDKGSDDIPVDIADDDQKSMDSAESPEKNPELIPIDTYQPIIRLPFAMQSEKSNLAAFRQRIQADIILSKHHCKKCDKTLESPMELFQHMADHFKWMRYACKLCNFKHYNFEHLPDHVKIVHKLKGDKDFYYSTVKAINGTEAMIISKCLTESTTTDDTVENNEASPESRRPSRCSSDSSRLSDDSSSSNTIKETGSRKRKMHNAKNNAKRKKEVVIEDGDEQKDEVTMDKVLKSIIGDGTCSNVKPFEENSSDMEDLEEKISKRHTVEDAPPVTSRRPVRKRPKPKHEDFEYDLSNLLKMEAQGYRDSLSVTTTKTTQSVNTSKTTVSVTTTKTTQAKKERKVQVELPSNYEVLNKDYCGALVTLSKKAVDKAAAIMKTSCFAVYSAHRPSNMFVRPMIPRILARGDKGSPKKDVIDDLKDFSCTKPLKIVELTGNHIISKEDKGEDTKTEDNDTLKTSEDRKSLSNDVKGPKEDEIKSSNKELQNGPSSSGSSETSTSNEYECDSADNSVQKRNTVGGSIPAVIPIKFRRQSLEIIKNNPIINKNITDFTKSGMKTKILVIKPINRKIDGAPTVNAPLKFQTIKLKDPTKSSSDDKQSDQIMLVQVPKVPCATATVSEKPVLVNTSMVDIVKNQGNIETKCEEKEITLPTENSANNENDIELLEIDDKNEIVTTNSDEVSDITVKDSVVNSDKSESVEAVS